MSRFAGSGPIAVVVRAGKQMRHVLGAGEVFGRCCSGDGAFFSPRAAVCLPLKAAFFSLVPADWNVIE